MLIVSLILCVVLRLIDHQAVLVSYVMSWHLLILQMTHFTRMPYSELTTGKVPPEGTFGLSA